MRQRTVGIIAMLSLTLLAGCGKEEPKAPVVIREESRGPAELPFVDVPAVSLSPQQRYQNSIAQAFRMLAEKNEPAALVAFRDALAVQVNDFVNGEIARLEARQAKSSVAERTASDIQTVLASGNANEAARLAGEALAQYGDSDALPRLVALKRQADALLTTQLQDQSAKQRFLEEAEAARKAQNYRVALLSFDQAMASGVNVAAVKLTYDDLRERINAYDAKRQRAAMLRRDATQLEEAIAALEEARQAWDTPQVRQEIDDCKLAMANRRDRLAVADFEVIGDVGLPLAGRTIAEEILPHFMGRFDLVERSRVNAILTDLKLDADDLNGNDISRGELGRLARARYVVVGSVSRLYGVSVNARLVDVQSGLIVQTARIVAGSPAELSGKLPSLARILQMTDEQKLAHERELAKAATIAPAPTVVPPAPVRAAPEETQPILVTTNRLPEFGAVVADDFGRIPPPASQPQAIVIADSSPARQRAFFIAIELGDNLYRRGRYPEAYRQYEFALGLSPGREDVLIRLNNCRPHLLPPVVIVPRQRLAVLPFAEIGTPGFVPPGLGAFTASALAPYFATQFDLVDTGEVFWWMGRLNMSVRDVLVDPSARLLLARAMDVRFMLLGNLVETFSFNANTYLVDAEFNAVVGSATVHARNPHELKLRLADLARGTLVPPAQRAVVVQENVVVERRIQEAQLQLGKGNFKIAIGVFKEVLVQQPQNVQARHELIEVERQQRLFDLEKARAQSYQQNFSHQQAELQQQAALEAEARRQAALRVQFDAEALARQQQQAQVQLIVQGRDAVKNRNFAIAINFFESAKSMRRTAEIDQELAAVRAEAADAERLRQVQEEAAREEALRQQRAQEAEAAKVAVLAEQQRRKQAERERREAEEAKSRVAYDRLIDQAQQARAKGDWATAVNTLQTARTLRPSPEVEQLVSAALIDQARADAENKGAEERKKLEAQLTAERERREKAEQEAARNQAKYQEAIRNARAAFKEKKYDIARQQFQLASATQRTGEAIAGLRQVDDEVARTARDEADRLARIAVAKKADENRSTQQKQDADAAKVAEAARLAREESERLARVAQQQKDDEAARSAREAKQKKDADAAKAAAEALKEQMAFAAALDRARQAIRTNRFGDADAAIADAGKIDPKSADIKKVQQELADARTAAVTGAKNQEAATRQQKFDAAVAAAKKAFAVRQIDVAERSLNEAKAIDPMNQQLTPLLRQLTEAKEAIQSNVEAAKRKQAYDEQIAKAQALLAGKRYEEVITFAKAALTIAPNDPTATQLIAAAVNGMNGTTAAIAAAAEEERKKNYLAQLEAGQGAMRAQQPAKAVEHYRNALKLQPNDAAASKGLAEATAALNPPKKEVQPPAKQEPPKITPPPVKQETPKVVPTPAKQETPKITPPPAKQEVPKVVPPTPKQEIPKITPPPQPKVDTNAQLNLLYASGVALEGQSKFVEAGNAFLEAAKLAPANADIRKHVEFDNVMNEALRDFNAGRIGQAVNGFEQAVKIFPDHPLSKQYLQNARAKKK